MKTIRRIAAVLTLSAITALPFDAALADLVLYDVDFGTPPHVIGEVPTTGEGPPPRDTVSPVLSPDLRERRDERIDRYLEFGEIIHLRVRLDVWEDVWDITLNGVLAHSGSIANALRPRSVRFSTTLTGEPRGVSAAIDNVAIRANLPVGIDRTSWTRIMSRYRETPQR